MDMLERMALLETLRDGVEAAYKRACREVFEEMEACGVDRARVRVAGVEVAAAQLRCEAVRVEDEGAYADWCEARGLARTERSAAFQCLPGDALDELTAYVAERWPGYVVERRELPDPRRLARKGPGGQALTEDGEPIPGLRTNVPAYVTLRDVADGRRGMNKAYVAGLVTRDVLAELVGDANLLEGGE